MKTLADFTTLVKLCIQIAVDEYGEFDAPIEIRYDLRGKAAGMAGWERKRGAKVYYLRFNREAINNYWDDQVKQTVPHEVAHLVAWAHPRLGAENHNWQWSMIDRKLGGTGERCHRMKLTPGRKVTRYLYLTNRGREVSIGPKHHKALQTRSCAVLTFRKTGETVTKDGFQKAA